MINQKRLLDCFLELVQIDSETGHEETIQPYLKDTFKKWGSMLLKMKLQNDGLGANNLICTLKSNISHQNVPKIYFTSHMDTVVPGKTSNL